MQEHQGFKSLVLKTPEWVWHTQIQQCHSEAEILWEEMAAQAADSLINLMQGESQSPGALNGRKGTEQGCQPYAKAGLIGPAHTPCNLGANRKEMDLFLTASVFPSL